MSSLRAVSSIINNWLHCFYTTLKIHEYIIHDENEAARVLVLRSAVTEAHWGNRNYGVTITAIHYPFCTLSHWLSWQQIAHSSLCCCLFKQQSENCGRAFMPQRCTPGLFNYYPSRLNIPLKRLIFFLLSGCKLSEKYSLSQQIIFSS